ncbi:hypothetical protein AK812_SmicGene7177 [Symbiodinium microadriaticum]|uniref:Uncharacterized protein n=1 Tax=Symbiodinium microadriaticum TaxID=2951 RepID=A0A1Q9EP84_SYMMI|nr:hypothetical protein AK812_SmicGene7177 [Symbiodinium microadriaticum]
MALPGPDTSRGLVKMQDTFWYACTKAIYQDEPATGDALIRDVVENIRHGGSCGGVLQGAGARSSVKVTFALASSEAISWDYSALWYRLHQQVKFGRLFFGSRQMRSTGKLLVWDNPAMTGVANKMSLRLNRFAIAAVLEGVTAMMMMMMTLLPDRLDQGLMGMVGQEGLDQGLMGMVGQEALDLLLQ